MTNAATILQRSRSGELEQQEQQRLLYHRYVKAKTGDDSRDNLRIMIECVTRSDRLFEGKLKPVAPEPTAISI